MENENVNAKSYILNYGVILGVATVSISVALYAMNMYLERSMIAGLLGFVFMIAIIGYGISAYKKANGNILSLSQALKIGVGIALIAGLIGALYQFVFVTYIEPDFMNEMLRLQFEEISEKNPDMPEEQLNMSKEMAKKFSSPGITMAFSVIGSIFFGFIISLVAGLIMKKENKFA